MIKEINNKYNAHNVVELSLNLCAVYELVFKIKTGIVIKPIDFTELD